MAEGSSTESGYYKSYKEFSITLRTWLIAYGIGGPVLVLSQQHFWEVLKTSESASTIGLFFLCGVILQVFFAATFKWAMWEIWMAESYSARKSNIGYKAAHWLSEKYFIDLIADFGAMALFAIATASLVWTLLG
jgi:hypothetical protein